MTQLIADVLREAAKRIREVAGAATPGPWIDLDRGDRIIRDREYKLVRYFVDGTAIVEEEAPEYVVDEPLSANPDNGAHIALWHPGVALAVAEVLEKAAADIVDNPDVYVEGTRAEDWYAAELALARLVLGERGQ